MRSAIRVLVVDDSALIRQMLTRALSMDPRIEIVGSAKTGLEAIERARELSPDVITLDIEMPDLDGLEALPHLRKHTDARVVMLSSLDDPDTTYRALSLGAVDFLPKPTAGVATSLTELTEVLLKKIKTAYRIPPERPDLALSVPEVAEDITFVGTDDATTTLAACVGVAASTGGPPALERVLLGLPASIPAAYLIVQHLPQGFSESLARRLDRAGEIRVEQAVDGMPIQTGVAYLAPHGSHMTVRRTNDDYRLALIDEPPLHGVRPAADLLFKSMARVFANRAVAVVLTGMGADGADGALAVRHGGGEVIVQDENTSVVWGMPGAAMRAGASARTVHVGLVAAEIRRAVRARAGER